MAYTTINKSTDYFNTKLYTGNGGTQSITGVGFQPDWSWFKKRNSTADSSLMDAVRGVRKSLTSNNTEVEYTESAGLSAFDSDGFSFDGAGFDHVNTNGDTFASWNWLGANGTTANTDGTISSTVSANTTSGFSIVSWTGNATAGATIGHGLGVTPKVIILKGTDQNDGWFVQHQDLGATKFLRLQDTNAVTTQTNVWNNTAPTSNVFSVGNGSGTNGNGNQFITYCFAEKQGYSKFGSYKGNGSTDGTFVYTGFKPAFLIVKNVDAGESWGMHDNKRPGLGNGNAPVGHFELYPNLSNVENSAGAAGQIDFLSNGFKLRTATNSLNVTQNYIYMAFASEPLVGDNPATAR